MVGVTRDRRAVRWRRQLGLAPGLAECPLCSNDGRLRARCPLCRGLGCVPRERRNAWKRGVR
jgi:hypothetical protein